MSRLMSQAPFNVLNRIRLFYNALVSHAGILLNLCYLLSCSLLCFMKEGSDQTIQRLLIGKM